ncbi:cytochrome c4 [Pseudoxanthomonas winnipegensis]|uniref:Cytochrome c4 n=1 Tax=Pseudoxanthomonas winnipegensis TaxID=2480810 RepID=A0A4Q8LF78_9GAMM|nr:cytochrome c4 [Pseudoxanthomonas winnipegensis]TAA27851.1 cytochrome c4 [Pseudoxanthomonas winnipegensis]TAA42318.1 cytochrome c4 [Pseudoxanthomonas winnipegensis]TBV70661.1 cytochrome c4 [Pseudoxanthomonas winnipegensis]
MVGLGILSLGSAVSRAGPQTTPSPPSDAPHATLPASASGTSPSRAAAAPAAASPAPASGGAAVGDAPAQASNEATAQAPDAAPAASPARLDLRRVAPIHGDASAGKAKAEVCVACHGANGIAAAPIFPNLAGQHADYLYWELVGYKRGMLPESPMTAMAAPLSEQDMRDLAAYFSSMPAVPPPGPAPSGEQASADAPAAADPTLMETGNRLYHHGDPAKGIAPCQGCHGADGRGYPLAGKAQGGSTAWTLYPALMGQQQPYLQSRLTAFRQGQLHASTTDMVMSGVAKPLDDDAILALSTWLSAPHP